MLKRLPVCSLCTQQVFVDLGEPLVAPSWDAGSPKHPLHGSKGQQKLFNSVVLKCKQFRTAVDVGAHIGTWTVLLAQRFNEVWAYEPVDENFALLRQNAKLSNVFAMNTALGAETNLCSMRLPAGGNSGCWQTDSGYDRMIQPLDVYHLDDVDFIKIDVEGTEGDVLVGAVETLQRSHPTVFFEDNGLGALRFGDKWIDPRGVLRSLGYKLAQRLKKNELWI